MELLQKGVIIAPEKLSDCPSHEQAIDVGIMEAGNHFKKKLQGSCSAKDAVHLCKCTKEGNVDCGDYIV